MTPQKQANRHDPANGVWGDCYRTAIACVLDLPRDQVPHVYDGGAEFADGRMREWLRGRGYALIGLSVEGSVSLESLLTEWADVFVGQGVHFLITGQSPRGTNHVVVARRGEIAWDPAEQGGGLVGPADSGTWWLEFIGALV